MPPEPLQEETVEAERSDVKERRMLVTGEMSCAIAGVKSGAGDDCCKKKEKYFWVGSLRRATRISTRS